MSQLFEFGSENPLILWKPVIEPDFGQERFLTDDPAKLFATGNFMHVPILAGTSKYEFLHPAISKCLSPQIHFWCQIQCNQFYFYLCFQKKTPQFVDIILNETLRMEMDQHFSKWAPICFLYEKNAKNLKFISDQLRQTFLKEKIEDYRSLQSLNQVKTISRNIAAFFLL